VVIVKTLLLIESFEWAEVQDHGGLGGLAAGPVGRASNRPTSRSAGYRALSRGFWRAAGTPSPSLSDSACWPHVPTCRTLRSPKATEKIA